MRTVLGVVAGYVIFAISAVALFALSGTDPRSPATTLFMVSSTLCGMLFALAGGYVAGAIARRHDRLASTIVAVMIAVIAGASALSDRAAGGSLWTQLAAIVLIAPSALIGGALHHRRVSA
jgi:hypothetical protein